MLWIMVLGAACVVLGIFNAVWGFVEALMLRARPPGAGQSGGRGVRPCAPPPADAL